MSGRGQGLIGELQWQGFSMRFGRAGHVRQDPFHCPSQEQGSWGAEIGSQAVGKVWRTPEGLGRDSNAHWSPQVPGSLFPSKALTSELPYVAFALIFSSPLMNLSFLANLWQHERCVIQSKIYNSL